MRTKDNFTEARDGFDAMKLENPLGLVFETPKSQKNLQSATLFAAGNNYDANNPRRTEGTSPAPISTWLGGAVAIAQILG